MSFTLTAAMRQIKGQKVRYEGLLPGVIYGAGKNSESVSIKLPEFLKLYKQAGEASLIDLSLDGKDAGKVLVQDVQYDPVSDAIIHVDLRRIDMNKVMTATVGLKFVGEVPVIKEQGGTLVTTVQQVQVKCLPKDLVSHIDVDLKSLVNYEIVIKIKDLKLPAGITITSPHAEDLVVKAARALTEEEIKKMEEEAAAADVSKIESSAKKKEEEETAEGAEGAAKAAPAGGADKAPADAKAAPAKAAPAKK